MGEQYVIFSLENQLYAVEVLHVNEITEFRELTKVPNTESYYEGIVNLRGEVIPIINLKKSFSIETSFLGNQILVIENEEKRVGLIIDFAKDVKTINENMLEKIDKLGSSVDTKGINQVIKDSSGQLIIVLDVTSFFLAGKQLDMLG